MTPSFESRLRGGLWGLLVGDALGVPYEFTAPEELPALGDIDMVPPADFPRAHQGVPPGTWSDDGAQALCLLASLLEHGRLDLDDLARRLCRWRREGEWTVDGNVFDVGVQTERSLRAFAAGRPASECGGKAEHTNGNGSLMRVLPLALWHQGSDDELISDAMRQSRVTHAHPTALVGCALYCVVARRILAGAPHPWAEALHALSAYPGPELAPDVVAGVLGASFRSIPVGDAEFVLGTGYVVSTVHAAKQILQEGVWYEASVRQAIAFGHDTDTTACVVGGLVGLRDGVEAIPTRWRTTLRGGELFAPLLDRLLTHWKYP